jgi:hypothetical protein
VGLFHTVDINPLLTVKINMSDDERAADRWENEGGHRSVHDTATDLQNV